MKKLVLLLIFLMVGALGCTKKCPSGQKAKGNWPSQKCVAKSGSSSNSSISTAVVTPSGTNVSVAPSNAQTVTVNGTVSFTLTPSVGYTVSATVGGTCPAGSWTTPGSVYQTGAITANCTVIFSGALISYDVTPVVSNLQTSPSGVQSVFHGQTQTFTVVADAGYFLSTAVGGTCPIGSWTTPGIVYKTGVITADCTVIFTDGPGAKLAATVEDVQNDAAGKHDSAFLGVALDGSNPRAVGYLYGFGNYDLGNGITVNASTTPTNIKAALVVGYSSSLTASWARAVTSPGNYASSFNGTAVDSTGNVFAAGSLDSTPGLAYDFSGGGTLTVTPTGTGATFLTLAKYDSSGTALWAQTVTPPGGDCSSTFTGVAADSSGNSYAVGSISGDCTNQGGAFGFGNGVTVSGPSTGSATVIVKYNTSGNAQWAKTVTNPAGGSSQLNAVAVNSSGVVYAVGTVTGTGLYDFGNARSFTGATSGTSGFVAKYDSLGGIQGVVTLSTAPAGSNISYNSLAIDSSGNVWVAGSVADASGSFDFGSGITASAGSTNKAALLVKYSAIGLTNTTASAYVSASGEMATFNSVGVDFLGRVIAGGQIGSGIHDFGNSVTIGGPATDNAVLVGFNSAGAALWAQSPISGSSKSNFLSLAIDSSAGIFIGGTIRGSAIYDFGNSVSISGYNSFGLNSALLKY